MESQFGGRFQLQPANSLSGPRVYSTDFHPSHFTETPLPEDFEASILRSLKVKLITKGTVTINGGHLLNPAVVSILRKHEVLLSDGLLLPALREDKQGFGDYIQDHESKIKEFGWTEREVTSAVGFIEDRVKAVIPWHLEQAKEAYRDRLVEGLKNPRSQVHRALLAADLDDAGLARIINEIEGLNLQKNQHIQDYIKLQPASLQLILQGFAHACYHVVGTAVVNCETGTDLSAIADFRIENLTGSFVYEDEDILSDVNIFLRCCFATAMQAINEITLPMVVVDAIPFERINDIRGALREQGFQKKYDLIVSDFVSRLAAEDDIRALEEWDAEKSVDLARQLADHYRRYIASELPNYRTVVQEEHKQAAIQAGAETVRNIGGSVPGIGELISMIDLSNSVFGFVQHGTGVLLTRDPAVANEEARLKRAQQEEEILDKLQPSNKATILTALRQLRMIASLEVAPN